VSYRWEGPYCIDTSDGEIVGRAHVYDGQSTPKTFKAVRGDYSGLYVSLEQAKDAVERKDGRLTEETPQRKNMLKDITTDAKVFIHENRNVIYWLALAFLVDHFFFSGAFRQRLNALVERMIGRVEKQLEAKV
jgi:hypothetical protein